MTRFEQLVEATGNKSLILNELIQYLPQDTINDFIDHFIKLYDLDEIEE